MALILRLYLKTGVNVGGYSAKTTFEEEIKMAKRGKKYVEAAKLVDRAAAYSATEAVELVKKTNTAKFDATVEAAFRLGVDPKKADQQIRGAVVLPHGTGKVQRVLVFAKGEKAKEAEAAGADFVGDTDYIGKIQQGWFDFDVVVATPVLLKKLMWRRKRLACLWTCLVARLQLNLTSIKLKNYKMKLEMNCKK